MQKIQKAILLQPASNPIQTHTTAPSGPSCPRHRAKNMAHMKKISAKLLSRVREDTQKTAHCIGASTDAFVPKVWTLLTLTRSQDDQQ